MGDCYNQQLYLINPITTDIPGNIKVTCPNFFANYNYSNFDLLLDQTTPANPKLIFTIKNGLIGAQSIGTGTSNVVPFVFKEVQNHDAEYTAHFSCNNSLLTTILDFINC